MPQATSISCERGDGYNEVLLLPTAMMHLRAAAHLFTLGTAGHAGAGSLSHLGLGLLLKTVLINKQGSFPAANRLDVLLDACRQCGAKLQLDSSQEELLARLDRYTEPGYPAPGHPVEIRTEDHDAIHDLGHLIVDELPAELIEKLKQVREQMEASQGQPASH